MRNFLILLFITNLSFAGNVYTQNISAVNYKDATLLEVFENLKEQTGFGILYKEYEINQEVRINMRKESTSVQDVLKEALQETDLTFMVQDEVIVIFKDKNATPPSEKQEKTTIRGKVTDEADLPLPSVTILIKGTATGTITNKNGEYALEVPNSDDVLVFSFVGFQKQEIEIGDKLVINVQLAAYIQDLNEVKVVSNGYQLINKESEAGSITAISGKRLESQITNNVLSTLEGLVPGLTFNNGSDGAPSLFLRGIGSFGNVEPLFVLDGQPISLSNLDVINPNDIRSVTVLKDAAAASIWGSGAANGVVVITTKRGASSVPKSSFNFRNSVLFTPKPSLSYLNRLSSSETIEYQKDYFDFGAPSRVGSQVYPRAFDVFFDNYDGLITDAEMNKRLNELASYNNEKDIENVYFNNSVQYLSNFSFSGQTDKLNYYGSVAIDKSEGLFNKETSQRLNAMLNSDYRFTKSTLFSLGINYTKTDNTGSPLTDYDLMPYERIYDKNGNPVSNVRKKYSEDQIETGLALGTKDLSYSPFNQINDEKIENDASITRFNLALKQDLINGLSATLKFQYLNSIAQDNHLYRENSFYTRDLLSHFRNANAMYDFETGSFIINSLDPQILPDGSILKKTFSKGSSLTTRFQLDYKKGFDKRKHYITAVAGVEKRKNVIENDGITYFGYNEGNLLFFPIDETASPSRNFLGNYIGSGYLSSQNFYHSSKKDVRDASIYFNANYSLLDKYHLNASTRQDRSSMFSNAKEFLGSVGVKWNIAKESFIKTNWNNVLDLRGTWGIVGNSAAISAASLEVQTMPMTNFMTGSKSLELTYPANKALTFEVVKTLNLGLDFALFKRNRIHGSIDVYNKKSSDVLAYGPINATYGWVNIKKNTADITNKGIEIDLNTKNIVSNNFNWTTQISFSTYKNTVDKTYGTYDSQSLVDLPRNLAGYSVMTIWAYDWAGLNDQGQPQVYYTNEAGERVKTTDAADVEIEDLKVMGSFLPTVTLGLSNTFSYKGLSLFARFAYNGGNLIRKEDPIQAGRAITSIYPITKAALGYWEKPGDEEFTDTPPLNNQTNVTSYLRTSSSISYTDGDYIKLRQLALRYSFDKEVIKKTPFKQIDITLQGDNLWYWAKNSEGIDPEAYSGFYGTRSLRTKPTYSIRVSLTF